MTDAHQNPPDFEALLKRMRAELRQAEQSGSAAERTVELDQARVGRLSRMDAMQAQAMSIETGRRRREKLRQIDAALQRIQSGAFGHCLECDVPIGPGRLAADPTVILCIECASARDS